MPQGTRAELINGVVLMSSPVGPDHARAHFTLIAWLSYYVENTPGVEGMDNASAALGLKSEPQPDVLLRILPECGGRTHTDRRFVKGAPELLVEVAHTSRYTDLGPKLEDYKRTHVLSTSCSPLEPDAVFWYVLRNGRFIELTPGSDAIYRSEIFPGLWLDANALVAGDTRRLRGVLDLGCATNEHSRAFVARLAKARRYPGPSLRG